MLSQLIKRLKAPVFEDEEKTRVAAMLNVILLAVFALVVLWLLIVPFISANPRAGFISLGIALLFTTGALIGLHRGYAQPMSIFFVSASWLLVTIASYFFGGVNNPGIHAYLLVILIAGLLLGGRVAIGLAGLSIISGLMMLYLRVAGLLPAPLIIHTPFEHWLVLTINLVITSVLLYLATNSIQSSLNRARREIAERQQTEAIRVQLEEQLRQAQKMEAIGTLAGGIAHEFNNILTTIIGRTEFALDMLPAENPVYQDLQSIRKISGRAANLVSQLLAFARSQVLELTPLNLNTLIENSRETFDRLVGENITIKLALASNLGWVKASPHLLGQVLADLVVNGRDALPMGGVITITTANVTLTYNDIHSPTELKPGEYVLLTVADNGVGISKEVLSHIFEPFFTTKEAGQGVGLGLAACFGIIKQHNGTIQVHSAPNEGATFQIYLPCSSKSDDRPTAPITVSPQGKTILFIEDDPSVRYISTRILNYHGYQVIEATNGLEALDIIQTRKQEIDLLVTDIVLPGMGGLELSDKLKSIQPDIKVLYTSGYAPSHFNQQEQAVIGNTFLQKPYSPHTLAEIVKELLLDD